MRTIAFDAFRLEPTNHRLFKDSTSVELRPKTFAVLVYLAERPGELVRSDELLAAVWQEAVVTPGTLNTSIRELRKELGDDARQPRFIETVHRRGFRFVASLEAPDAHPVPGEARGPARQAVESLPEEQRRAVVLHYLSGLSLAELGRVTATPVGSVATRVLGALSSLGAELEKRREPPA